MEDLEIIETLRTRLIPKGLSPVVKLNLNNVWFKESFVQQAIDDLEVKLRNKKFVGDEITPLEKLAIHLLMDSADIQM